ncbi:MAG: glucose-6-phosphate dehydrogenase [Phycisphaerales bacterium]|nr:MAG: glucose-6-phosphate dehydrogenase [Phycisphaerales bacterium]
MQEIQPSVTTQEIACEEITAPPCDMVVFGASGDLVRRKLLVSLQQIFAQGLLNEQFNLIGCGRKDLSDEQFRQIAREAIEDESEGATTGSVQPFLNKLHYISGSYDDLALYRRIKGKLVDLDTGYQDNRCRIFYLAVPPFLYGTIVEQLGSARLSGSYDDDSIRQTRLVVEKPFGKDLQSAVELNSTISRWFGESQVYRIDHYLGKETVQNILMFRFANTIFEPVWNRNHIDSIQITIAETLGVEHRASYYDKTGALRDMFQNHMLQMLTLVAMEPPVSFQADHVRDEKVKLLRSIRPLQPDDLSRHVVRGQYGPGFIDGKRVVGYRAEPAVDPKSRTETFVAAKLFVDNWRWKNVPFYLRTGKRLARKNTEIAVTFKKVPHSMFALVGLDDMPPDVLVLRIQPEEGIYLSFQAKRPGSKICMGTLNMNFSYKSVFGVDMPNAYQRLLLDCMVGDQTLFTRFDGVETAWQLLMAVLETWQADDSAPYEYTAGGSSFPEADELIESDDRTWRPL